MALSKKHPYEDHVPERVIVLIVMEAERAATTTDGHIDRAIQRKLIEEAIFAYLDSHADVVAIAQRMAVDVAMQRVAGRRRKNKLKWSEAKRQFLFHPDSIITVDDNTDVLVMRATYEDWLSARTLIERNLRHQMNSSVRFGHFVDQLARLYETYGDMTTIITSEFRLIEDTEEGESYDGAA